MRKNTLNLLWAVLAFSMSVSAQELTRGIGIYPGRQSEYTGPTLRTDKEYRNIALHRAVYQSSSVDNNLTAQLLTDGVADFDHGARLHVYTPAGLLSKRERESTLDGNDWTRSVAMGADTWLRWQWEQMAVEADEAIVHGLIAYSEETPSPYKLSFDIGYAGKKLKALRGAVAKGDTLLGDPTWQTLQTDPDKQVGSDLPTRHFDVRIPLKAKKPFDQLRLHLQQANAAYWAITELELRKDGKPVRQVLPSQHAASYWLPEAGDADPWVYVDLGTTATIKTVNLLWAKGEELYAISYSDDAIHWRKGQPGEFTRKARYVRVNTAGALAEIQVFGTDGLKAVAQPEVGWQGRKYFLNGGDWTLVPGENATADAEPITATVPATVLMSYVNAGALPDPNYDDNISMISESFFNRSFTYSRTFQVPAEMTGKRLLLNFDGINWKADIFVNDKQAGHIDGAFMRGQFDITTLVGKGDNQLRVVIHPCDNPGGVKTKNDVTTDFNGGILGADNPTFHATIGWDWITTVRGRDIGIWNDVYLTATDDIIISDPLVTTTLRNGKATMTPSVFVKNVLDREVKGTLKGFIGDIHFEQTVSLPPHAEQEVTFSPDAFTQLKDQTMHLWWPNGYGDPYLYEAGYTWTAASPSAASASTAASLSYQTGIREVTYSDAMTRLQIFINGRRFIPMGGNWGFSEHNLNYREREYDTAVGYHRQMNYNMIRNWVGQTGDEEFFEACDRHGIMVWQDFWLANPVDGPNPDNEAMFMANANDFVRLIRRHPSIALYCGRNEGYPPASLNKQLGNLVRKLSAPLLYIPSSADDGVSGHGPYQARPIVEYFQKQTGKLHTERGMPNIPTIESLRRMLSPDHLWPQGEYWGRHDFTQQGAQAGASFNKIIEQRFGKPANADDFTSLAQWQNYDGYRAMYEAANSCQGNRQGLIIWMSHSCWPSMVWQTYDYYFNPTAAFFGVKKACEPLHAQYNVLTGHAELVNIAAGEQHVTVAAHIYNKEGKELWSHSRQIRSTDDTTIDCFPIEVPASHQGSYLLRLTVSRDSAACGKDSCGKDSCGKDSCGKDSCGQDSCGQASCCSAAKGLPADNSYLLSTTATQQDLRSLPQARVSLLAANDGTPDEFIVTNTDTIPAFMVRLNLVGATDNEQVLPVEYSDNYFHLLPGEQRRITIRWKAEDARGQEPKIVVSGFNVDTFDAILPLPSQAQIDHMDMETYAFIHFTTNTFNDMEWGYGDANPRIFNPRRLDCDQWARVLSEAGMKGIILTAKHHDGFCLWPTKLTDYNITKSPYKNGRGDIVGELAAACRKYGLKFGLYLSPWDRHQASYGTQDYVDYYHAQLNELLDTYGPLFEVWLDGANGGDGYYGGAREKRNIDRRTYYNFPRIHDIVWQHNPQTIIFSDGGPGCRWVGNENGFAGETNWAFLRRDEVYPGYPNADELFIGHADGNKWIAAECDVSIRPGWFYHKSEDGKVKTPEQLFDLYCKSVGRNATFLLNVPVNRDGLISRQDITSLQGYKALLTATFDGTHHPFRQEGDYYYAAVPEGEWKGVILAEDISRGQRVKAFTIEYQNANGQWKAIPADEAMTTIGHKRIIRLSSPVEATMLRLRITDSRADAIIKAFECF
jgi:alpha-L-fucosidase